MLETRRVSTARPKPESEWVLEAGARVDLTTPGNRGQRGTDEGLRRAQPRTDKRDKTLIIRTSERWAKDSNSLKLSRLCSGPQDPERPLEKKGGGGSVIF